MSLLAATFLALISFAAGVLATPLLRKVRSRLQRITPDSSVASPVDVLQYERKVGQFALFAPRGEIVCLGDSRVEHADWNEVLNTTETSNRGISGDTTAGIVKRLQASIPGPLKLCIVQAGVNDVWRGVPRDVISANYDEIIRYVVDEKRAQLLITAVVLVDEQRAQLNAEIAGLNTVLMERCQRPGVHWLDLNATLAPAGYLEPRFTDDGTHFTGAAYKAIAEPLRLSLARVLDPRRSNGS